MGRPCLCAFDIDRTLTAGQKDHCPSTTHVVQPHIFDNAYARGNLKLSEAGYLSIAKTQCKNCYTAIVSRGDAAGVHSDMRKYIMDHVIQTDATKKLVDSGKIKLDWTDWRVKCNGKNSKTDTPFIVKSPNECKKYGVEAIRQLYAKAGVDIAKRDVFFFDDHSSNIPVFKNFGFNAFEIGCESHLNSHTSRCGATNEEIRLKHLGKGYEMCAKYSLPGVEKDSCKKLGCGGGFKRGATCQCTDNCKKYGNCCDDHAKLCQKSEPEPEPEPADAGEDAAAFNETRPCMCAFDIDRTLTAGQKDHCPSNIKAVQPTIYDNAYARGNLRLSEAGALSIAKTTCKNCYTAIVSRGDAAGKNSKMRQYIIDNVIQTDVTKKLIDSGKIKADWTDWRVQCHGTGSKTTTPFIVKSPNECKKHGVEAIRKLYAEAGVNIAKRDVFFFDDHSSNIPVFKGFGFNAFEIGCASHKHSHTSRCGATEAEIRLKHLANGYEMCRKYG